MSNLWFLFVFSVSGTFFGYYLYKLAFGDYIKQLEESVKLLRGEKND